MAAGKRPKYVSLEPAAFLSDVDFQMMTAEERGVYWSIILYLYCNNGRMKYDLDLIIKVCNIPVKRRVQRKNVAGSFPTLKQSVSNKTRLRFPNRAENDKSTTEKADIGSNNADTSKITISKVCNAKPDYDFQTVLQKFKVKRGWIYHKRVTKELRKAQVRSDQAITAANTRWKQQCGSNADASPGQCQGKEREGKEREGIKTSFPEEFSNSDFHPSAQEQAEATIFADKLDSIIKPTGESDRKALLNLVLWAARQESPKKRYTAIIEVAKGCVRSKKPISLMFHKLRQEIGYNAKAEKEKAR